MWPTEALVLFIVAGQLCASADAVETNLSFLGQSMTFTLFWS